MTVTTLGLAVFLALAGAAAAAVLAALAVPRRRLDHWADRALLAAFGAVSLPLLVLALDLLTGNLELLYVWRHSRTTDPWWLRLSGIWGGQEGTYLLWAWVVLGAASIEARRAREATWPLARAVLGLAGLLLVVPALLLRMGRATREMGLTLEGTFEAGAPGPSPLLLRPEGQGLNPLLETVYMAIHPPLEFLAYGLLALPFAYALAHLVRGGAWREGAERWARPAWLALAAALALGALWAYNVLSFGGYWAWDPVETADLLPFLAITLFLHAGRVHRPGGPFGLLTPGAATGAFVLVVFATFVTRTGLWASVHAFLPTGLTLTEPDPLARLARITASDASARYATGLLFLAGGALSAGGALLGARAARSAERTVESHALHAFAAAVGAVALLGALAPDRAVAGLAPVLRGLGAGRPLVGTLVFLTLLLAPYLLALARTPLESVRVGERRGQLVLASGLLLLMLLVTFSLLLLGVNGSDAEVYTSRAPFLAAPVLALQAVTFHLLPFPARARVLAAAAGLSLVLLALSRSMAWAAVPLALVAIAGPALLFARRARPQGGRRGLGAALALLASGVLGLLHWTSPGVALVGPVALGLPTWYAPIGLAAAAGAILGPFVLVPQRRWLAVLSGVLAVGYGLGALAALVAGALGRHAPGGPSASPASAAIPLLHLAVAGLVLGVALSTYATDTWRIDESAPLERGVPQEVGPWTLTLVDGAVLDTDGDGRNDTLTATLHVHRDSTFVGEETARLEHAFNAGFTARGAFVPEDTPHVRTWRGDLVLDADPAFPLAVRLRGGNTTWIVAGAAPPQELAGTVDAVATGLASAPGVNLVWSNAALLVLAMGMRVSVGWGRNR